jgi:hypothetical protein
MQRLVTLFLILSLLAHWTIAPVSAQSGTGTGVLNIDAVVPGCGDGLVTLPETCDGFNLGGNTCGDLGFGGGTLSCTLSCTYNTTLCTAPSSGGGGGSSSGGSSVIKKGAQVVLTGTAYPQAKVTVLKDGYVVATAHAGTDSRFQIGIQTLTPGTYMFSVYAQDGVGTRSALLTFPTSVTKNILAKIENILISPTITTDKFEVKKNDVIVFSGQGLPQSTVSLSVGDTKRSISTDTQGVYRLVFDTSVLRVGEHTAYITGNTSNGKSSQVAFTVGTQNVFRQEAGECGTIADFNKDCRVNLIDFSIAAFWFERPLSPEFVVREREHANGDGKINLVDFSIMAFHWTG